MGYQKIARAVDIGFGYTKLSKSTIDEKYSMSSLAFPSFPAPADGQMDIAGGVMQKLQIVTVEVNGIRYVVGPDSLLAATGRQTRAVSNLFFSSPQYSALYLGALAYMNLPASVDTIHALGMGLPFTVWRDIALRDGIKSKMTGTFTVPIPESRLTREIRVDQVHLWPQVLGALVSMSAEDGSSEKVRDQNNLVIDVGYGTMLWIVSSGFRPQTGRSDGNNGGASSILKAVAKMLDPQMSSDPRVLDRIDVSLRTNTPLILNGAEVDLQRCRERATSQAHAQLSELIETIGTYKDLDNIFLAGGGAHLYAPLLATEFKGRTIRVQTKEPQMANLKGYQHLVERQLAL